MKATRFLPLLLGAALLSGFAVPSNAPPHNPNDEALIRQVIERYGEGLRTGDIGLLERSFHPQAIWAGHFGGNLIAAPIETMYQSLRTNPVPAVSGEPYAYEVVDIDVVGDMATAEVVESSFFGHNFITRFHLIRVGGDWQITSKLFTVTGMAGGG